MTRIAWGVFAMVVTIGWAREVSAQYSVPSQAASQADSASVGRRRSKIDEQLITETGWEVGASLNFLTAETSLGGEDVRFTDVVLLRLHGLWTVTDTVELFVGSDVLPKQPSYTDELEWQGGLVGARFAIGDRFAAWVRGQSGPHLDQTGWWVGGSGALQYKLALEEVLFFESSLGWAHTQLFYDADPPRAYWLGELFASAGVAIREPRGRFGAWLNFDYFYPIVGNPGVDEVAVGAPTAVDPQPRVNFHLGGIIAISTTVDLFVAWSILDRGDLEDPTTTLPILNGGFDQKQLLFGFMRRFGLRKHEK